MDRWREAPEMRVTILLLTGGLALVAAGTAGVAASLWLVGGLCGLAAALAVVGPVAADSRWTRVDPHLFLADLWLGPLVAAVVLVAFLDATAGEVQALGGLLGLTAMANYFLRPVYHLLYGLGRRLADD